MSNLTRPSIDSNNSKSIKGEKVMNNLHSAIQMKEAFDKKYNNTKALANGNGVFKKFKTVDNEYSVIGDINKGTISIKSKWGIEVSHVRNYTVFTFGTIIKDEEEETILGIYGKEIALAVVGDMIRKMNNIGEVKDLISDLRSKVLVDLPEETINRSKDFYGRRKEMIDGLKDQQLIIETNKVNAVIIAETKGVFSISKEKYEFNGKEIAVVAQYFALKGEPVVVDKNNKKYFIIEDGCRAAGVDLVDGKLITLNPVPSDNGAKILNRIASHGFLKADNVNLLIDEDVIGLNRSNLLFALSNDNYTAGTGVEVPVFVTLGGFNLNNGILETNAAKNVRFEFQQIKNLNSVRVDLYAFDEEYRNTLGDNPEEQVANLRKEVDTFIREWAANNSELKANEVVKFNGVKVLANPFHYNVSIVNHADIRVDLGGADFDKQIRSLVVKVKGQVVSVKKSPKVRGLTKKATAYQTNTVITKDGEVQDWVAILNRELIKGSSAILDVIANDDEFINSRVIWNKGVLTIDGKVYSQDDLIAWLEAKCETYVIKRQISQIVADEIKDLGLTGVDIVEEKGVLYAIETVDGFFGHSMMEVEVSTADENHGISHHGLNEQQILALAGKEISEGLDKVANEALKDADLLTGNKEVTVFKLPQDAEALKAFFSINVPFRTKKWMGAMAKKSLHGIRIEWDCPKKNGGVHTWNTELPFGIFLRYGSWDKAGNPEPNYSPVIAEIDDEINEDVQSSNVLEDVFNFINVITSENVSDAEKKSLFLRSNIFTAWVNTLRTAKNANKFTKAGVAFHQKVVGDLSISNVVIGADILPVVKISPNNPMIKNKGLNKAVKNGEAVVRNGAIGTLVENRMCFLSRCPLPLFTAVIVKFDENLDDSVIAVNPVVWIKSNLGDFDGDLGYLTDSAQFNMASPRKGADFNKSYSPLFTSKEGSETIKDALSVAGNVIGAKKGGRELLATWTELANEISLADFALLAANVNNHYKYTVGRLYNVASALTQELGNKSYHGNNLDKNEVAALNEAWFLYEETGLGGWKVENANKYDRLRKEINRVLKHRTMTSITPKSNNNEIDLVDLAIGAIFFPSIVGMGVLNGLRPAPSTKRMRVATTNGRRRGRIQTNSTSNEVESEFNPLVIKAACNTVIGAKIQNGQMEAEGNRTAVIIHATRVIARKEITKNEENLFNATKLVGLNGRFTKHIEVIAALRSQIKQ